MINPIGGISASSLANLGSLSSFMPADGGEADSSLLPFDIATGDLIQLARTNSMHYTSSGQMDQAGAVKSASFEDAMLKALDGVNAQQNRTTGLVEQMIVSPDSVDAHEVTVAMAEASMSLNIARTILDRIVRGWKEVINTR